MFSSHVWPFYVSGSVLGRKKKGRGVAGKEKQDQKADKELWKTNLLLTGKTPVQRFQIIYHTLVHRASVGSTMVMVLYCYHQLKWKHCCFCVAFLRCISQLIIIINEYIVAQLQVL